MRITKKFAGATSIGKVVYQPADLYNDSKRHDDSFEMEELKRLEIIFLEKLHGKDGEYMKSSSRTSSRDNREATSPATAKITEIVERIRNHDRNTRNSSKRDDSSNARSIMPSGMKRIVSAPNFSQLSSLQTPWKHREDQVKVEATGTTSSRNTRSAAAARSSAHPINFGTRIVDDVRAVPYAVRRMPMTSVVDSSFIRSKKRSQSVMDFQEYEHLSLMMMNDSAAGRQFIGLLLLSIAD
jgi:hypothetical protein